MCQKLMLFFSNPGGIGGQSGHIQLLQLNKKENITKIDLQQNDGKFGPNGINVSPCISNKYQHFHRYSAQYRRSFWTGKVAETIECNISQRTFKEENENCADQHKYAWYNTDGREGPSLQSPLDTQTPIMDYKTFIKENMNVSNPFRNLKSFYDEIEQNDEIRSI